MRGLRERSGSLFSYVSIEERIPASHPLRRIHNLADQVLDRLNPTFCDLYAAEGQPSVPPELLLLASLLLAYYGIRWFVGQSPDDPIWHPPRSPLHQAQAKRAGGTSSAAPKRCVRCSCPVRDRRKPDPAGHSAQPCNRSCRNGKWTRGVTRRQRSSNPNC